MLAVASEVSVRDFAALHGISVSLVRRFITQGLPCFKYEGKYTIPREAGARWLERFRHDRVAKLVDQVLQDLNSSDERKTA